MTRVYRDFDQETLDREYSARGTVPDFTVFTREYTRLSEEVRATQPGWLDAPYGPHPDEVADVFPADASSEDKGAPVFVFIHGGYWRTLSQRDSVFMAPCFVGEGVAVVSVNYSLAPAASIDTIVRQCRGALAWVRHNAAQFGGDPERIFVGGTSAGGHLVGMMLASGWRETFRLPEDLIKGALVLNGLHDLEPVMLSAANEWARLNPASARRNSPIHNLPPADAPGCPIVVSWGGSETPEFKRQSGMFAEAWAARGWPVTAFERTERNHFDIVFDLCDADSPVGRATLDMIHAVKNPDRA